MGSVALVVCGYRRPHLLERFLKSLSASRGSESVFKVFLQQGLDQEIRRLFHHFSDARTVIARVPAYEVPPYYQISLNYYRGFNWVFEKLDADWVISTEEDTELSRDWLDFCRFTHNRFNLAPRYRGINLSSVEDSPLLRGTYSLLRSGLQGHAGVLTRRTWAEAHRARLFHQMHRRPIDQLLLGYLESGFMVTPNLSKARNRGWIDGTHFPNIVSDYFAGIERSWHLKDDSEPSHGYRHMDFAHSFTRETRIYRRLDCPAYDIRYLADRLTHTELAYETRRKVRDAQRRFARVTLSGRLSYGPDPRSDIEVDTWLEP